MKIKADNRGRISLAQLGAGFSKKDLEHIGEPHTEWNASVRDGKVTFTYAGPEAEGKQEDEWVKVYPQHITPEMIGEVIGVYSESDSAPMITEESTYGTKSGLYARLMSFSTYPNLGVDILLEGKTGTISTYPEGKSPRLKYLWVKSSLIT